MKTIKQVIVQPQFVTFIPDELEQDIIYISKKYKTAVHLCLCGCKNLTFTPLNNDGWILHDNDGKISLTPSIGNYNFPCKSHYIITNNRANFVGYEKTIGVI